MKKHLLITTAIAGLAFFAATPAFASCSNPSPGMLGSSVCNDADVNGVSSGDLVVTVTVTDTGSITTGGPSIYLSGAAGRAVIDGHVESTANHAVVLSGAGSEVTVNNGGTVLAAQTGVSVGLGGVLTINTGGSVEGDVGFVSDDVLGTLSVYGTLIGSGGNAAEFRNGSTATFTMSDQATITGNVVAGAGSTDSFTYVTTDNNLSFDTDDIDTKYLNFETFTKNGNYTWTLDGTTAKNWTINAGTNYATISSIANANVTSGILVLGGDGMYSSDLSGAGTFIRDAGGAITFSGINTINEFIIRNGADVTFANADAAGSANHVINASKLTFDYNGFALGSTSLLDIATIDVGNYDGQIGPVSGSGKLVKEGWGALTLTGTTANSGGIDIVSGSIIGTTQNITGDITLADDSVLLAFDQNFDGTFSGSVTNTGSNNLRKTGTGTLTLGGAWASSGITPSFYVEAGKVVLDNNTMDQYRFFLNGGTLSGSGSTYVLSAGNGGMVELDLTDEITATGVTLFNNGSIYRVNYDSTGASGKLIANDDVTLDAGSTLSLIGAAGTYADSTTYTIMEFSGLLDGEFGTVTNNLAFLTPDVIYNANDIQVRMDRNNVGFGDVAADEQQRRVANALNDLAGSDLETAFTGLTVQEARHALDQLGGEHNSGVAGALSDMAGAIRTSINSHMVGLNHAFQAGNTAALAPAKDPSVYTAALLEPVAQAARYWFEAIGGFGKSSARATTPGQDRHSYGALAGVDMPFDDAGWFGFFGGYENGDIRTKSQNASSDLDNYHLGAYVTQPVGNGFNLGGGVGGTYHDIETSRTVSFPGFLGRPQGDTYGYTLSAFAELSKPLAFENISIEPFANLSLTRSHMSGYSETNGNGAELAVGDTTETNPATVIGARFGKSVQLNATTVNLNASLGWQHTFGNVDGGTSMRFAAGTTSFDAFGPPRARDSALVGLGASVAVGTGMNAYAGYDGSLAGGSQDHGFRAGIKVDF